LERALIASLAMHPDARADVIRALRELETSTAPKATTGRQPLLIEQEATSAAV
jgi:hypothetical protein